MESFIGHPLGIGSYIVRFIQIFSSIVVLGLTAWAVQESKTLTVIYSLTIATSTLVIIALSVTASCITRRYRWHIFPLIGTDCIFTYLWLTSFIFLARDFNQVRCEIILWNGQTACGRKYAAEAFSFIAFIATLVAMVLEITYIYRNGGSQPR